MPDLDTRMHVNMLLHALKREQPARDGLYGLHWGDPDVQPGLRRIRDHWLLPFVDAEKVALEVGPGGGRWTRYLLPFRTLYAVDYHRELLAELRKNFPQPNIVEVANNGADFPGVPPGSVDFVFSFGVFVHLEAPVIRGYLDSIGSVLHPQGQAVIQYSDKDKQAARDNPGFADNNPRIMRAMVEDAGFRILEEDTGLLLHSSVMRFGHGDRPRRRRKVEAPAPAAAPSSAPAPAAELRDPPARPRRPPLQEEPLRYPDFLCLGVQKAGTTWLDNNLRRHPSVWLPPIKELGYFSEWHFRASRKWVNDHRRTRGIKRLERYLANTAPEQRDYRLIARLADIIATPSSDHWYGRIFSLASKDQVCGEVCPDYAMLSPEGIRHVLRLSPEIKVILLLRDPIERAWSHVRMHLDGPRQVDPAVEVRYGAVTARTDYPAIIRKWREFVPEERFFISFMESIGSEPDSVLKALCGFLRIDYRATSFSKASEPVYVGAAREIPDDVYGYLKDQLRPVYEEMRVMYPEIGGAWYARHYGG